MTEEEAKQNLNKIFEGLGICQGDLVYLGVDMGKIPLPNYPAEITRSSIRAREKKWFYFFLESLCNLLGPDGTILVPAFTYSHATEGSTFIVEESEAEVGPFYKLFSILPNIERSNHPLFSVAGTGPLAAEILLGNSRSAFGATSVFGKLKDHACKFLCMGTTIGNSLTYIHHLEQMYGCNGRYNKVFHTRVIRNDTEVAGPWLAYVSFRSVEYITDCHKIENKLRDVGKLNEVDYLSGPNQCATLADVDEVGYAMLEEDQCGFRSRHSEIVFDESDNLELPSSDEVVTFKLTPLQK